MNDEVDRPLWYPNGRRVSGQVCFVVQGSGAGEAASRDDAYNELLVQVSEYLGYDVAGRYYRELVNNQSIADLSLEVDNSYNAISSDGRTHYHYLLAFADEDVIIGMRSEAFRRLLAAEAEVVALKASALEHYKANNDVEAIREVLCAMTIASREGVTSEGNSPEDLLALATGYLSSIEIRLSREDGQAGTVRVRVVRNRGLLSPSVSGAPVTASFTVHNHMDGYETFSVPFVTGADGSFIFEEYYPQMTDTGTVHFSLDIDDELAAAEAVTGEAFLYDFRRMAEGIQASFDYDMSKALRDSTVLVIMDEYDGSGRRLETNWARDAFISYFNQEGIETDVASTGDSDFTSAMDELVSTYSDYDWIIWSAVGLSPVVEQPDGYEVYVAEGYTLLLDTRGRRIVNLDEITRSVSWGSDREACLQEVFSTYGSSVAGNMSPYF